MDPSRSHSPLHHLEASTLPENNVLGGNADVIEDQVCMAVWRIIVPIDGKHALDFDTWCIRWHENDRLLLILVRVVRVCLSEDDID